MAEHAAPASPRSSSRIRPCRGVFYFAGAYAVQPDREHRPHVHPAEAARRARRDLRPGHPAPAARRWPQVEGAKFFMQSGQDISVGGRLSRTQYQYTLTDTDSDELNHWAPIVEAAMQKLPELQDVASDQQIAAPHIAIEIDRDAASRLGHLAVADRRDAVRRVRPAPGRDDLHLDQPVQGHPRGQARVPERPDRAVEDLCRRPERRAGAAQQRSPISRRRSSRCRSAIRASSRR